MPDRTFTCDGLVGCTAFASSIYVFSHDLIQTQIGIKWWKKAEVISESKEDARKKLLKQTGDQSLGSIYIGYDDFSSWTVKINWGN